MKLENTILLPIFLALAFLANCQSRDEKRTDISEKKKNELFSIFNKEDFYKYLQPELSFNIEDSSNPIVGLLSEAMNKKDAGDLTAAIELYRRAIEMKPDEAGLYILCGNILYDQGKGPPALKYYEEAIRVNPKLAVAYFQRGGWYYEAEMYERAAADYKTMLTLHPNFIDLHVLLAHLYEKQNKPERALASYKRYLDEAVNRKQKSRLTEFVSQRIAVIEEEKLQRSK